MHLSLSYIYYRTQQVWQQFLQQSDSIQCYVKTYKLIFLTVVFQSVPDTFSSKLPLFFMGCTTQMNASGEYTPADYIWFQQSFAKRFQFIQRLAVAGFVSSQPPYFRLIRKAVWSTMVTNNVCGSVILFISVQIKKGMSEDSTHRKPLLCLVTSFIRAAGDR